MRVQGAERQGERAVDGAHSIVIREIKRILVGRGKDSVLCQEWVGLTGEFQAITIIISVRLKTPGDTVPIDPCLFEPAKWPHKKTAVPVPFRSVN